MLSGHDVQERDVEKEQLEKALDRSSQELQELRRTISDERDELTKRIKDVSEDAERIKQELKDKNEACCLIVTTSYSHTFVHLWCIPGVIPSQDLAMD